MSIIVTGGAGFIGSNFVLDWLQASREPVIILDKLTYAGNPENFATVRNDPAHQLVQGILVTLNWSAACWQSMPRAILNFAAESHVDRSIHGPGEFIQTNIVGTFQLLEAVRAYWEG